jgi:predicted amidohydrolase
MGLMDYAARLYLSYKFNVRPLNKYISGLKTKKFRKPTALKVAATQVEFRLHRTAVEYFEHMKNLAERAAEQGTRLIAYPENIHLPLYGLLPGIEKNFSGGDGSEREGEKLRNSLMLLGPFVKDIYFETFSSIARLYEMYVMGGSITVPENGELYNTAYLFGPDGKLIGSQRKLHITPDEEAFGLKAGDKLNVYQLPFGKVAFPVCMDATYYETFEIARENGADIVIIPIANMEEYEFYRALRGIWPRVQESRVFGIKSALVGKVSKFYFTGKAGIFAPIDLSEKRDGIIKETENYLGDDVIAAEIDVKALIRYRENDVLLQDRNDRLYEKYFSRLYNMDR